MKLELAIKYYKQYKEGQIKLTELARLSELSRNTVYKYIKILEEESLKK